MKLLVQAAVLLAAASRCLAADPNVAPSSRQILPATFQPPQVFKNADVARIIDLQKGYIRESVNVVIENVSKEPQSEYYIPFEVDKIGKVGGLQVRDKQGAEKPAFDAEVVEYDAAR